MVDNIRAIIHNTNINTNREFIMKKPAKFINVVDGKISISAFRNPQNCVVEYDDIVIAVAMRGSGTACIEDSIGTLMGAVCDGEWLSTINIREDLKQEAVEYIYSELLNA